MYFMRAAIFLDITQRRVGTLYRRFGTTYLSHLQGQDGTDGCPETSVQNYHCTLRNILEERRSHLHRGGSLK
jgi:hypothetical protein